MKSFREEFLEAARRQGPALEARIDQAILDFLEGEHMNELKNDGSFVAPTLENGLAPNFIFTISGKKVYFERPNADDIVLEDIAHGLAYTNRFCGHASFPISVAHHSIRMLHAARDAGLPESFLREALLHDAAEAYLGDVTAPLKRQLGRSYRDLEDRFAQALHGCFGVPKKTSPEVRLLDQWAMYSEVLWGMPGVAHPIFEAELGMPRAGALRYACMLLLKTEIVELSPSATKALFLGHAKYLGLE